MTARVHIGIAVLMLLLSSSAMAVDVIPESPELQACLKRADDLPDIAAAEAGAWLKKGGGNDAHLCHAFAQSNRGMHEDAAREFWYLAAIYDKKDVKRAASLHALAGQEFMRAKKPADAEPQYIDAIKENPADLTVWIAHAKLRIELEKYWDAINELNYVLKKDPDNLEALRQRGSAWQHLGNTKNAQEDFVRIEELSGQGQPK